MQDVFLYMVRGVLPPTHFILVETLACVCRDFTKFPTEFRRANGIDTSGVDLYGSPMHGIMCESGKRYLVAYGRVMASAECYGITGVLRSMGVKVVDSGYDGHIDIAISARQNGLLVARFAATQTNSGLTINDDSVLETTSQRTAQKFEIAKEVMRKYGWGLCAKANRALAHELMKTKM